MNNNDLSQKLVHKIGTQKEADEVELMNHIVKRGNRYYYRRRYPVGIIDDKGQDTFRISLRTDSRQEANLNHATALVQYENIVKVAKRKLEEQKDAQLKELSESEVMGMVSSWYRQALRTHEDDVRAKEMSNELIEDREAFINRSVAEIEHRKRKQLAYNQYGSVSPIVKNMLRRSGFAIDTSSLSYQRLSKTVLQADIALKEGAIERLKGNYDFLENNSILQKISRHADLLEQNEVEHGERHTIAFLFDEYVKDNEVAWSKSTLSSYQTVFKFLDVALGKETLLGNISRDTRRVILDKLLRLPLNWAKLNVFKGLALDELIEKGEKLGLPVLHKHTVNDSYLSPIKALFQYAEDEGWIEKNHFVRLMAKQSAKEKHTDLQNKRRPFQLEALKTIFNSAPWSPRDEHYRKKPSLFWCPLIALYHGFRRGEVSGLLLEDIDHEEGVLVFVLRQHFDDDEDERTLKTESAYRVIPVHPELIKMGFERFVQVQRDAGHRQLFPEAKTDANGKWGRHLTEWFSKRVRQIEKEETKCTFHSLRHNFTDALREADLFGTPVGQAVSGRRTDYRATNLNADTVADEYGTRYKTSTLVPHVAKIKYEGLDLSHLYVDDE